MYHFFGKLSLKIDGDRISFQKKLCGFRHGKLVPNSPRSNIDRLVFNCYPQTNFFKDVPPPMRGEIVVVAGVREYRILISNSEAECEWLLAELSELLNLPVIKNNYLT
jgi:hypothetical protein